MSFIYYAFASLIAASHCRLSALASTQPFIEYKNFELGVLFHSGQQPAGPAVARAGAYVQYKAYNRACQVHRHPVLGPADHMARGEDNSCFAGGQRVVESPAALDEDKGEGGGGGGDAVVVLPVPYDMLRPDPYCDAKGFRKEPYFHDKSEVRTTC